MAGRKKAAVEGEEKKIMPEKSDAAVAAEIEVKKTVRAAGRKAKAAVKDAGEKAAEELKDAAFVAEVEVKKNTRKAARKAKEAVDAVAAATKKTVKKAALEVIIQSPMGGEISTDEIAEKLPDGVRSVYVRVDENKLYWVKDDETGSVDIW